MRLCFKEKENKTGILKEIWVGRLEKLEELHITPVVDHFLYSKPHKMDGKGFLKIVPVSFISTCRFEVDRCEHFARVATYYDECGREKWFVLNSEFWNHTPCNADYWGMVNIASFRERVVEGIENRSLSQYLLDLVNNPLDEYLLELPSEK